MSTHGHVAHKPKGLIGKAIWVLRYRREAFLGSLRGYFLFERTRLLRSMFGPDPEQVSLGQGVRLQKLRCLHAEKPGARISIGDHSIIYEKADIGSYGNGAIEIGECSVLGDIRMASRYGIRIGKRFISSWNVFIQDFDPHPVVPEERAKQLEAICAGFRPRYAPIPYAETYAWPFPGDPIEIGDDVWIGANCTILKGAKIGNGCIVATGAVVLGGEYPARSIIGGNPAKVVKTLG
jgi:acetyltransferase-like isoleucine patch superfamily enzyme